VAARTRRKTFVSVAVGAALLVVLLAAVGLTQIDIGRHTPSARRADASSTTTVTTQPPTTTTTKPRAHEYVVKAGDTLSRIASRFGVTTAEIAFASRLVSPDRLTIGQRLTIPPAIPVVLSIRPATVTAGDDVRISLSGAKPGEHVTFRVDSPGGPFTGPAHIASPQGKVATSYGPSAGDPAGVYTVTARGNQGTLAQATFTVRA
jgi:LysM repeat protein